MMGGGNTTSGPLKEKAGNSPMVRLHAKMFRGQMIMSQKNNVNGAMACVHVWSSHIGAVIVTCEYIWIVQVVKALMEKSGYVKSALGLKRVNSG